MTAKATKAGPALLLVATFAVAACTGDTSQSPQPATSPAPPPPPPARMMFGVPLNAATAALCKKVESLYKRPIREEIISKGDAYSGSDVTPDGQPMILRNPNIHINEMMIVHEAYHLILRGNGYAVPAADTRSDPSLHATVVQLFATIRDPIQHTVFYDSMRAAGHDPTATTGPELDDLYRRGDFVRGPENAGLRDDPTTARAVFYFRVALEARDPTVTGRLREFYTTRGWADSIAFAEPLIARVRSGDLKTPKGEWRIALEIVNAFLDGFAEGARLEQISERTDRMGDHREWVPELKLVAAKSGPPNRAPQPRS